MVTQTAAVMASERRQLLRGRRFRRLAICGWGLREGTAGWELWAVLRDRDCGVGCCSVLSGAGTHSGNVCATELTCLEAWSPTPPTLAGHSYRVTTCGYPHLPLPQYISPNQGAILIGQPFYLGFCKMHKTGFCNLPRCGYPYLQLL